MDMSVANPTPGAYGGEQRQGIGIVGMDLRMVRREPAGEIALSPSSADGV